MIVSTTGPKNKFNIALPASSRLLPTRPVPVLALVFQQVAIRPTDHLNSPLGWSFYGIGANDAQCYQNEDALLPGANPGSLAGSPTR